MMFSMLLLMFFQAPIHASEYLVYDLSNGQEIRYDGFIEEMNDYQVIFIGDVHDDKRVHEFQLDVLKSLGRNGVPFVIAMEMFQQPFQPYLDAYIDGYIDEKEMVEHTEYETRWGFDSSLYAPIWRFARQNEINILAINIPTELVSKVRELGVERVNTDDLPDPIIIPSKEYVSYVEAQFKAHPSTGDLKAFMNVQLAWDNGMALGICGVLKEFPGKKVVVIVGAGHVYYGLGIPDVLTKLSPGVKDVIVVPVKELEEKSGDFGISFNK